MRDRCICVQPSQYLAPKHRQTKAYLVVHEHVLLMDQEQPAHFDAVWEAVVLAALATALLALDDRVYETRHHVELGPVNLGRVVVVMVRISFVSSNEVGKVNFSDVS